MLGLVQNSKNIAEGNPFYEDVDELGSHRDVEDTKISDNNTLTDEVEINFNMFGALILDRVGGELDGADAVH
jgi:hypothetical protein